MLPRAEQLVHHLIHLSRIELKRTSRGANIETSPTSTAEASELTNRRLPENLDSHTAGTFHFGLKEELK